jgi:OmcA/MtrC family decaheme c-type cytochrome
MKSILIRLGLLALMISGLAGCGGGGSVAPANPGAIPSAAANPANDTSINASAPFTAMMDAGISPVVVTSGTPGTVKVNFSVFSDGAVVQGLTTSKARFALAKLVPGTNGDPDQWVNYVSTRETKDTFGSSYDNNVGTGAGGTMFVASAVQATTDPATVGTQLKYNPDGYYTYTFTADITDPAWTKSITSQGITKDYLTGQPFERNRTHRIAIQLSYVNKAGDTVLVNPYFDFTIDGNGNAVAVTDPSKTRKMTDVASCNTCHAKLALHGGGRVDTQFCVMCHNSRTKDANSGNVLDLRTMAHKIHAGKFLANSTTPESYTIWGYNASKVDFAEVGFPQDLRNCTKCHTSANPNTPQGDNWKNVPTREACLTCHQVDAQISATDTRTWTSIHTALGASVDIATDAQCANCHSATSTWGAERVHWNQNEEDAAKYKMNIESATYDSTTRKVTVKYFLSDPTNGDAAYDLTTGCSGTYPSVACDSGSAAGGVDHSGNPVLVGSQFGPLKLILAFPTLKGQPTAVTEFSSYNNGGNVNAAAYSGHDEGGHHYSVDLTIPADKATFVAAGTARVVSYGQVIEPELDVVTRSAKTTTTCTYPTASTPCMLNVSVQNTYKDVALSGTLTPRREIVSNDKCNACHSLLGTTSGSNILNNAFHDGSRDIVEACVVCHDPDRMSSTVMADGSGWNESYQFKRMIHGIHGGQKRTYPFTHGNKVVGNGFALDGTPLTLGGVVGPVMTAGTENFTAEVAFPGHIWDCTTCHVNKSYQNDQGPLGAVINKPTGVTDPLLWNVSSPKVATCTACHDDLAVRVHMLSATSGVGGGVFGTKTQGDIISGNVNEICTTCHAPGVVFGTVKLGVDVAHGL